MLLTVDIVSPLLSSTWNQSLHYSWEPSPSQYVLHLKKKKRKEHHNQTFNTKATENQLKNQMFRKKSYWKSTQLIKNCTTLRWLLSLWDKVLCRKIAGKRVEDGADNQSVCSQVLVRQISQLANATSTDSTDENYCECFLCICSSNVRQNNPPSLLMQLWRIQPMKIIANSSCCICSSNLRQNNPPS
jgi:hypothetical protein